MRDLPAFARFWMICRNPTGPHSQTRPIQRYSRLADAETDARRLAADTGAQFLILETVGVIDPADRDQKGLDL